MTTAVPTRRRPGWTIVARKELADHLSSLRLVALTVVLGLAAGGAVYAAAGGISDVAELASGTPALFLQLFTVTVDPIPFPFIAFVGLLGPLLGIAFGFDAINGERAQGTLPRLVSQPIYRDDVINGKFVAGLGVIALVLTVITAVMSGVGIARLGIAPTATEVARIVVWLVVAVIYVGFWLAFAMLCSVLMRRAATSALVAIAAWLVVALFAVLLARLVAGVISPAPTGAPPQALLENARTEETLSRLSPATLYDEATAALLNPAVRTVGVVTIGQLDRAVTSNLSLVQSVLLVWPQIVALVALTVVSFAVAYVAFMRQEIRA